MKYSRILGSVLGVFMLVAGLAFTAPATAATGPMSEHKAGRYYLAQICRENHANDALNKALPLHNGRFKAKDMHGKTLTKVRVAMRAAFRAYYKSGRKLLHPPAAWPSNVKAQVNKVAAVSITLAVSYRHLANDGKQRAAFATEWVNKIMPPAGKIPPLSAKVRAKLNLPPPGSGC